MWPWPWPQHPCHSLGLGRMSFGLVDNPLLLIHINFIVVISLQNLPAVQNPEVFGMHENVSISKELQETKHMFDSILLTQGRFQHGTRANSETDDRLFSVADGILQKVKYMLLFGSTFLWHWQTTISLLASFGFEGQWMKNRIHHGCNLFVYYGGHRNLVVPLVIKSLFSPKPKFESRRGPTTHTFFNISLQVIGVPTNVWESGDFQHFFSMSALYAISFNKLRLKNDISNV